MNPTKKVVLVIPILSLIFLNQPPSAYAWFFGFGEDHHRQGGYSEVLVGGGGRYYYNEGIFYTGVPGNYVVVPAPVGAIVYDVPADIEQVNIDGDVYFRSHDIYYKHEGRGYRVIERPQKHEHQEEHHRQ